MSKKTNELSVALSIPEGITVLNKKIAAMKSIQESVYVTSGKIQMAGGIKDIKEEKNVNELVKALSGVIAREEAMVKAYEMLGITSYPAIKIDGATVEEWVKDIKLRIAIIEQKETLDELTSLKKEWEELMDKEDRKALLVEKMKKFTNS